MGTENSLGTRKHLISSDREERKVKSFKKDDLEVVAS